MMMPRTAEWSELPDLVMREILGRLERIDLRKTAAVCRRWRSFSRSIVPWSISITMAELSELTRARRSLRDAFPDITDLTIAKTDGGAATKIARSQEARFFHGATGQASLIALLGSRPRRIKVVESAENLAPTVEDIVLAACVRPTTRQKKQVVAGRISPYENMYDRLKLSLVPEEEEEAAAVSAKTFALAAGQFVRDLFSRTQIPRPPLEAEFEFAPLETVDVSGCPFVNDETIKILRDCGALGERLSFAGCPRVTADGLAAVLGTPALRILDASNTDMSSGGGETRRKRRKISGGGAAAVGNFPPSKIEMLSLHGSKIGSDCARQLARCANLSTLDLSDVDAATSQHWELPIAARNLPNLERIDVSGWKAASAAAIACATNSLKSIRIDSCPEFDRACLEVVLYKATSLRRLVLTGTNLLTTREVLHEITEAKARRRDVPWTFVTVLSIKPDTAEVVDALRDVVNLNGGGDGIEGRPAFVVPADEVLSNSSYEPLGTDALLAFAQAPSENAEAAGSVPPWFSSLDRRESIYDEFRHAFFVRKVEIPRVLALAGRKRRRAGLIDELANSEKFISRRPRLAATKVC